MSQPLIINYYTDMLCVWAWIAQRRIEELESQWGAKIELRHHPVNVFGDTQVKMERQWADRGGFDGFADHVQSSAARYEEAPIHPDLWRSVRPTTSATAHLMLQAIQLVTSTGTMVDLANRFRHAFFVDAVDISNMEALLEIAAERGISRQELVAVLADAIANGDITVNALKAALGITSLTPGFGDTAQLDNAKLAAVNAHYRFLMSSDLK